MLGLAVLVEVLLFGTGHWTTGAHSVQGKVEGSGTNVAVLGKALFTTYLLPFEVTSALLVVAIVAAVVLARAPRRARRDRRSLEIGQPDRTSDRAPTDEATADDQVGSR